MPLPRSLPRAATKVTRLILRHDERRGRIDLRVVIAVDTVANASLHAVLDTVGDATHRFDPGILRRLIPSLALSGNYDRQISHRFRQSTGSRTGHGFVLQSVGLCNGTHRDEKYHDQRNQKMPHLHLRLDSALVRTVYRVNIDYTIGRSCTFRICPPTPAGSSDGCTTKVSC